MTEGPRLHQSYPGMPLEPTAATGYPTCSVRCRKCSRTSGGRNGVTSRSSLNVSASPAAIAVAPDLG